ncbi:MAG: glycosyltransferase family 2 protein [Bacteroidota bacterium]|nr:glycosyltransferase family 2 protein [Bacteroidota bacterium]
MNKQSISVVIPNYNGRILLQEIIPPLIDALQYTRHAYEIIVVDDCSNDDSVHFLSNQYPLIKVLQNNANKGFAPTMNKGIFAAQHNYLFMLNTDVKLNEDYFMHLFRYFERGDTFGVMGRITAWDNDNIEDGGKYPSFHGAKIKTSGNYVPIESAAENWLYSMYLSGANSLVSREKVLELQGFDEIFAPFYVEDFELSLRAWRLGWRCYYEDKSICRHRVSSTIKSKNSKRFIETIYNRNKMFLHALHLSGLSLFRWYLQTFFEVLFQCLLGRLWYAKAFIDFIANKKKIKSSKNIFEQLCRKHKKNISTKEVTATIIRALQKKQIKIFK